MRRILFLLALPLFAQDVRLAQVASGLSAPTDIQNAADGSARLFLVQQNGIIRILKNGTVAATPFLDIHAKTTADGERGLLGLAFPPGFAQKQRFYVDYTDLNGDSIIAQYRMTSNPDVADPASEIVLLKVVQPFANHNGGQIRFGPDGYLYIAFGDGGSGGDPFGNGQNLNTMLGKLLRVDVESQPGKLLIPPDNPFATRFGARPEVWAYGLRNPWRFSFDRLTHDLWIGDVGQDLYEEVDFQPASSHGGEDYGWNIMEGLHCYNRPTCNMQGLTLPVAEYTHDLGCSITGGFVYRGRVSPNLRGLYFYSDDCSGRLWALERQGNTFPTRQVLSTGFNVTTFGEDEAGEIYLANAGNGTVHHLVGGSAPRFTAAAVVNAASFVNGIVPGSFATVFAFGVRDDPGSAIADRFPLPLSIGGVSVTVAGVPAPVYSASNVNGQESLSFQVPWSIAGRTQADIVLTRDGQASPAATVAVSAAQPGVFTTDGRQAIVVDAVDYHLATAARPLVRGEDVFLYATGLGPVANQPADGTAAPSSPPFATTAAAVQITIGGIACDVQFAGLPPGLAGVYQVNFRVGATVPTGTQDMVVTVSGGPPSPAVQTIVQ
jgi:uncharacterized protein (TIGR03437 family)